MNRVQSRGGRARLIAPFLAAGLLFSASAAHAAEQASWTENECAADNAQAGILATTKALKDRNFQAGVSEKVILLRCRGYFEASIGEWGRAHSDLAAAVSIDSANPNTFFMRGLVYVAQRKSLLAFNDFDMAVRLRPDHAPALIERGIIHDERGEFDKGIKDFNKVLALPNGTGCRPCVQANLGTAHLGKKDYARALQYFNEALSGNPGLDTAVLGRGIVYERKNRLQEAMGEYSRAIELAPNSYALTSRGFLHLRLGAKGPALDDAEAALGIAPDFVSAIHLRGVIKFESEDTRGALADFKEASALSPKNGAIELDLALAELRMGNAALAEEHWRHAVRIEPAFAEGPRKSAEQGYYFTLAIRRWYVLLLKEHPPRPPKRL